MKLNTNLIPKAQQEHKQYNQIKTKYTAKSEGEPSYYLENDYKWDKIGRWCIGCKKYIKEALTRVERNLQITLEKKKAPIITKDSPEIDETKLLTPQQHQKYQMLIGILNWIIIIG